MISFLQSEIVDIGGEEDIILKVSSGLGQPSTIQVFLKGIPQEIEPVDGDHDSVLVNLGKVADCKRKELEIQAVITDVRDDSNDTVLEVKLGTVSEEGKFFNDPPFRKAIADRTSIHYIIHIALL